MKGRERGQAGKNKTWMSERDTDFCRKEKMTESSGRKWGDRGCSLITTTL